MEQLTEVKNSGFVGEENFEALVYKQLKYHKSLFSEMLRSCIADHLHNVANSAVATSWSDN